MNTESREAGILFILKSSLNQTLERICYNNLIETNLTRVALYDPQYKINDTYLN